MVWVFPFFDSNGSSVGILVQVQDCKGQCSKLTGFAVELAGIRAHGLGHRAYVVFRPTGSGPALCFWALRVGAGIKTSGVGELANFGQA